MPAKRTRPTRRTPANTIQRQSAPPSLQLVPAHPPLGEMTPDQARLYLGGLRERLQKKMARERAYLDRRAARGTHTPTDDAYEDDQQLEAELLDLLDEIARA